MPKENEFLGIKCRFEPVDFYSSMFGRYVDGGIGCFDMNGPSPFRGGTGGGGVTIDGTMILDWAEDGTLTCVETFLLLRSRYFRMEALPIIREGGYHRAILETKNLRPEIEDKEIIETGENGMLDFRFVVREVDKTVKLGDFIWALVADGLLIGFRFDFRPLMT